MKVDKGELSTAELINYSYQRKNKSDEGPFTINQEKQEVTLNKCLSDMLTSSIDKAPIDPKQKKLLEYLGTLKLDKTYQKFFEKFVNETDIPKFRDLCDLGHKLLLESYNAIKEKFSPAVQKQREPADEEVALFKAEFYQKLSTMEEKRYLIGLVQSLMEEPMYKKIGTDDKQEIHAVIRECYKNMEPDDKELFQISVTNSDSIIEEPKEPSKRPGF